MKAASSIEHKPEISTSANLGALLDLALPKGNARITNWDSLHREPVKAWNLPALKKWADERSNGPSKELEKICRESFRVNNNKYSFHILWFDLFKWNWGQPYDDEREEFLERYRDKDPFLAEFVADWKNWGDENGMKRWAMKYKVLTGVEWLGPEDSKMLKAREEYFVSRMDKEAFNSYNRHALYYFLEIFPNVLNHFFTSRIMRFGEKMIPACDSPAVCEACTTKALDGLDNYVRERVVAALGDGHIGPALFIFDSVLGGIELTYEKARKEQDFLSRDLNSLKPAYESARNSVRMHGRPWAKPLIEDWENLLREWEARKLEVSQLKPVMEKLCRTLGALQVFAFGEPHSVHELVPDFNDKAKEFIKIAFQTGALAVA